MSDQFLLYHFFIRKTLQALSKYGKMEGKKTFFRQGKGL